MAANSCVHPTAVEQMKKALKEGDIDIADLYRMNSDERRALFGKYVSDENAKFINGKFETAMVSSQKSALKDWAENTFNPKEKTKLPFQNLMDKIDDLDKLGVLNPTDANSFLKDLVADRLGVNISPDEIKNINRKSEELQAAYDKKTDTGLKDPEYYSKLKEMNDYVQSLVPSHDLKVATSVIGRGNILAHIPGIAVKTASEVIQGGVQFAEKRIAALTTSAISMARGGKSVPAYGANADYMMKLIGESNKIFWKTGYSPLTDLTEYDRSLGDTRTHSQGKGIVRAVGRAYESAIFHGMYGVPANHFGSFAFADTANILSTQIAQTEGLKGPALKSRALELMKESVANEPGMSKEAQYIRAQAQSDYLSASFQQNGTLSKLAMGLRNELNKATGDIALGDQIMPIVKTPANVIQTGLDYAGIASFKGFAKLPEAFEGLKTGDTKPMQEAARLFVRNGLGMALAAVLVHNISKDDFNGAYASLTGAGRDLVNEKNAPYNSVKFGDKYISLAFLGSLAPVVIGGLYMQKYGANVLEKAGAYGFGAASDAAELPGLSQIGQLYQGISTAISKHDVGKTASGLSDEALSYLRSRLVPSFVKEFAAATDNVERDTGKGQMGKTIAAIPGLRETLPEKTDQLTGGTFKTEGINELLTGARVKTANDSPLVEEITRLSNAKEQPSIADIRHSTRVRSLTKQIGEDMMEEAINSYGTHYGMEAEKLINTEKYQQAADDEKKDLLNKVRSDGINKMLKAYGYNKHFKESE